MIAVLQARLGSTRLPGKAFFTFFGQNMVERAISIAREVSVVDQVVLATGDIPLNMALERPALQAGASFIVGSENNVLERFAQAIEGYTGEYLLRMTCDNYLVQPDVIESLHAAVEKENADYGFVEPLSHFSGEIVRCDTLRACLAGNPSPEALEHVTWDIRNDPSTRKVSLPADTCGINHQRGLTLDTIDDLIKMKTLEAEYPDLRQLRCLSTIKSL